MILFDGDKQKIPVRVGFFQDPKVGKNAVIKKFKHRFYLTNPNWQGRTHSMFQGA